MTVLHSQKGKCQHRGEDRHVSNCSFDIPDVPFQIPRRGTGTLHPGTTHNVGNPGPRFIWATLRGGSMWPNPERVPPYPLLSSDG